LGNIIGVVDRSGIVETNGLCGYGLNHDELTSGTFTTSPRADATKEDNTDEKSGQEPIDAGQSHCIKVEHMYTPFYPSEGFCCIKLGAVCDIVGQVAAVKTAT